jgi:hypothetical protein
MSLYYAQTLISKDRSFAPQPRQILEFFDALKALGSVPLNPTFRLGTIAGVRTGTHPLTGESLSIPRWSYTSLNGTDKLDDKLQGIQDYNAVMAGEGPAEVPPFEVYTVNENGEYSGPFAGQYDFQVECCVRVAAASTSDWHEEIAPLREGVSPFSTPSTSKDGTGFFHHPCTGEVIEVRDAGCARFWIEFQCGKLLLPKIANDLNVLQPSILRTVETVFSTPFVQGCHWG